MKGTLKATILLVCVLIIAEALACCGSPGSPADRTPAATPPAAPDPTTAVTLILSRKQTPALESRFPQLDSSTARKDMVSAIYRDFVGQGILAGPEPLCSMTHQAILNLIDGTADVVFALRPTQEEKAYMDAKGVDLKIRCYAYDALMILGNAGNPVNNLSVDQLRDIYRKKITNWKEVGGPDAPISVYVRNSQSGSQRMFESLVWDGVDDMPDFQSDTYADMMADDMGEITNAVEGDLYAIGYNFMTYIDREFSSSANLKSFAVSGVAPTRQNIMSGTYPFITTAWILMRADDPADSPAQWFFDWFTGYNAARYITAYTSSVPAACKPEIIRADR